MDADVGARLKELREAAGMSQQRLARASGVSQSHISEIEAGRSEVTVTTLKMLCSGLGITLADFFAKDGAQGPYAPAHLVPLLEEARSLTPEQAEKLVEFIRTMKGR